MSMKNYSGTIGNRTRDLPAGSEVLQLRHRVPSFRWWTSVYSTVFSVSDSRCETLQYQSLSSPLRVHSTH